MNILNYHTDILKMIPNMKTGNDLISSLEILPKYNNNICNKPIAERLIALSDLYSIYIPSDMSIEIYNKLYLSLLQSLKKKSSSVSTIQRYENHKAMCILQPLRQRH